MAAIAVRISRRHQIKIPSIIRKELKLEAGDRLLATVRDGIIILVPERRSALDQLRGLHREIWEGDIQTYLDEERDAWEEPEES
jgi:AbrB family looped-hinge helix DNA binding protein